MAFSLRTFYAAAELSCQFGSAVSSTHRLQIIRSWPRWKQNCHTDRQQIRAVQNIAVGFEDFGGSPTIIEKPLGNFFERVAVTQAVGPPFASLR